MDPYVHYRPRENRNKSQYSTWNIANVPCIDCVWYPYTWNHRVNFHKELQWQLMWSIFKTLTYSGQLKFQPIRDWRICNLFGARGGGGEATSEHFWKLSPKSSICITRWTFYVFITQNLIINSFCRLRYVEKITF